MNSNLAKLQPYPFEKLAALLKDVMPPSDKKPIAMSIGEPRQAFADFIRAEIVDHLDGLSRYPMTQGSEDLRMAIGKWLTKRFSLKESTLDIERNILPVNGTREALFAIAQCVVDPKNGALVLMPNPFYQIYEGAALLAGGQPWYVNIMDKSTEGLAARSRRDACAPRGGQDVCRQDAGAPRASQPEESKVKHSEQARHVRAQRAGEAQSERVERANGALISDSLIPDFDSVAEDVWRRCQLLYLCSPGNPTGAVLDIATLQKLIELADRHDFVIASDECYSEIYFDDQKPPASLLSAAAQMGRDKYDRCLVFNSLSKRSSLPGLRSGLVAGDANLIEKFRLYRTYHGSAMSPPVQAASAKAWSDEKHVVEMRAKYRQKFAAFDQILSPVLKWRYPDGGFFIWLPTPMDDQQFARQLYQKQNLTVLPGSFLSRPAHGIDPGHNYVRIALVGEINECHEAAERLKEFVAEIMVKA